MINFSFKSTAKYLDFVNRRIGVMLSHVGMALLVLGVGVVSSYSSEKELIIKPGEKVEFLNKDIELLAIKDVQGPNFISKTAKQRRHQSHLTITSLILKSASILCES